MVIYEQVYTFVTAAATQVSDDTFALKMLLNDFIGDPMIPGKGFYWFMKDGQTMSMMDSLVAYLNALAFEDPLAKAAAQELTLEDKQLEVAHAFLQKSYDENITSFIMRDTIVETIRLILLRENRYPNMVGIINSNRIDPVIHDFAETFKNYSARSFGRNNSFAKYVGSAFQTQYYMGHTIDIWETLRAPDQAKNSLEFNVNEARELTPESKDDLYINQHVKNIQKANQILFRHNGRDDDNHGILYDIFYLVMIQLCRKEVEAINIRLNGPPPAKGTSRPSKPPYVVKLVDMKNRNESTPPDQSTNPYLYDREYYEKQQEALSDGKNDFFFAQAEVISGGERGIGSKISNAIDLIPVLFDRVKEQSFSLSQLTMLRTEMFYKELRSTDGKQSIWVHDSEKQAKRYLNLDTKDALLNYERFDSILKGVMSVYTLITEVESRGISLPEFYRGELFINKEVTRYIDYLSAVPYLDLMLELQAQPSNKDGGGTLYDFKGMIYHYIGSPQNGHDAFRLAREQVDQEGFSGHPRLKTNDPALKRIKFPPTRFERLGSIQNVLSAIPCYCSEISQLPGYEMQPKFVDFNTYNKIHTNYFVFKAPRASNYVAKETVRINGVETTLEIHEPKWVLGQSNFNLIVSQCIDPMGSVIQQFSYLPLPYDNRYYPYAAPGDNIESVTTLMNIYDSNYKAQILHQSGQQTEPVFWSSPACLPLELVPCLMSEDGKSLLPESIQFPFYSGIRGIYKPEIISALKLPENIYRERRKHIKSFVEEWGVLCEVQDDVKMFLQDLVTQCIYGSQVNCPTTVGHTELMKAYKNTLRNGLMRGHFNADDLNLVLCHLGDRLKASRDEVLPHYQYYYSEANKIRSAIENSRARGMDTGELEFSFSYYSGLVAQLEQMLAEPKSAVVLHFILDGDASAYEKLPGYAEILEPILDFEDPATRLVMLINLLNTKLNTLKIIRDAYYLVAGITKSDLSSLSCELDIQFAVTKTLQSLYDTSDYAVMVDKLSSTETKTEIKRIINATCDTYHLLIGDIITYLKDCAKDLAGLLDYSVQSKQVQSKLEKWGQMFAMQPPFPQSANFKRFRDDCDKDSAGFLMRGNKYFYGTYEDHPCYVHATGRILWARSSHELVPLSFEFVKKEQPGWENLTAEQKRAKKESLSPEERAQREEFLRNKARAEQDERERYWNILKGSLPNGYT